MPEHYEPPLFFFLAISTTLIRTKFRNFQNLFMQNNFKLFSEKLT